MGEIMDKCFSKEGCLSCKIDEERYEELIKELSQLHNEKNKDPETLYRSSNNHFAGKYREIISKQNELFTIACKHYLPWTEKYRASDF